METEPIVKLPKGGTELERVVDGSFAPLIFLENDPENPGELKPVTIRTKIKKISIQRMDELAKCWGKFALEVACYTGLAAERVAQLSDESFEMAMSEGRRLNFTSFEKWYRWQTETLAGLGQADAQKAAVEAAMLLIQQEIQKQGLGK